MNQTIFENLPRKMNLISDLFSRVVFRDKEACQDLVRIILGRDGGRRADSCRVSDIG